MGLTVGDAVAIAAGLASIIAVIIIFKPKKNIEREILYGISNFLDFEFGFKTKNRKGQTVDKLEAITETQKKIKLFLFGNGSPKDGVQYILMDLTDTLKDIKAMMKTFHKRLDIVEKKHNG